ncbi:MAG: hypothetical protein ACI88A_004860 [Paraglaciecola sp.]|jgi:hypothetical protein
MAIMPRITMLAEQNYIAAATDTILIDWHVKEEE